MDKAVEPTMPEVSGKAQKPARIFLRLSSGLALACYVLAALALLTPVHSHGVEGWIEGLMLLAATGATLAAMTRDLPAQNVIVSAGVVAVIGGIIHATGAATGIPFGIFTYTERIGPSSGNMFAWPMPLLWVVVLLNSRGVGRLMLRPWRKMKNYGFWLMGVTTALMLIFVAVMDPFAADVRHYWIWGLSNIPFTWQGTPLSDFLGWAVGGVLIQAFITPALMKRRPGSSKSGPNYHPLYVWELAMALCAASLLHRDYWLSGGFGAAAIVVTMVFALRGARW